MTRFENVFIKRRFPADIRVISAVKSASLRLYIRHKTSKVPYLIDTGADFSILPERYRNKYCAYFPVLALQTASDRIIKLFGEKTINVNLGLRYSFRWTFREANVTNAFVRWYWKYEHATSQNLKLHGCQKFTLLRYGALLSLYSFRHVHEDNSVRQNKYATQRLHICFLWCI